jgi:hypothetical protein
MCGAIASMPKKREKRKKENMLIAFFGISNNTQ